MIGKVDNDHVVFLDQSCGRKFFTVGVSVAYNLRD